MNELQQRKINEAAEILQHEFPHLDTSTIVDAVEDEWHVSAGVGELVFFASLALAVGENQ